MANYRLIGDVHGKWDSYKNIIDYSPHPTIQVGDFGVGFGPLERADEPMGDYLEPQGTRHRFIRGNHDNPAVCKQFPQYIQDGTVENNVMFVGGAWSIDRGWRTPNWDWWEDEELSIEELHTVVDVYRTMKPEIMITHDCPQSFSTKWIVENGLGMGPNAIPTRTGQALDAMLSLHTPKLWVFGHWHTNIDVEWNDTRFICLNELDWCDLNTETAEVVHHRFFQSVV